MGSQPRRLLGTARYRLRTLVCDLRDLIGARPPEPAAVEPRHRVLFVCLGNICRSPTAHGILRARLAEAGLYGTVAVDSAGTLVRKPGRHPDPRARACARRHRVPIGDLRSRQVGRADLGRFDSVVVFDRENLRDVLALAGDDGSRARVRLLVEDHEVADPVFGRREDFERAFAEIDAACDRLLAAVRAGL